jgi:ferredoxin
MIGTEKKPMDEILEALGKFDNVVVTGCNGCSKVCKTGGEPEVNGMAEELRKAGKNVVLATTPERGCYIHFTKAALEGKEAELAESEAVLVLGCGGATQIMRQTTEEFGMTVPVKAGLNTVGHVDVVVPGQLAVEQCGECGLCVLNETGGICPVTKCAKSLLNGPCGGSEGGKCEVDSDRDCAWILIYERLKALNELESLKSYKEPPDHRNTNRPRRLTLT